MKKYLTVLAGVVLAVAVAAPASATNGHHKPKPKVHVTQTCEVFKLSSQDKFKKVEVTFEDDTVITVNEYGHIYKVDVPVFAVAYKVWFKNHKTVTGEVPVPSCEPPVTQPEPDPEPEPVAPTFTADLSFNCDAGTADLTITNLSPTSTGAVYVGNSIVSVPATSSKTVPVFVHNGNALVQVHTYRENTPVPVAVNGAAAERNSLGDIVSTCPVPEVSTEDPPVDERPAEPVAEVLAFTGRTHELLAVFAVLALAIGLVLLAATSRIAGTVLPERARRYLNRRRFG